MSEDIPADEPRFILRASDVYALPGLYGYYDACIAGDPEEYTEIVEDMVRAFKKFRRLHQKRMKQPGTEGR